MTDDREVVIRGSCWQNRLPLVLRPAKVCREVGSEVARDLGFRVGLSVRQPR